MKCLCYSETSGVCKITFLSWHWFSTEHGNLLFGKSSSMLMKLHFYIAISTTFFFNVWMQSNHSRGIQKRRRQEGVGGWVVCQIFMTCLHHLSTRGGWVVTKVQNYVCLVFECSQSLLDLFKKEVFCDNLSLLFFQNMTYHDFVT